MIVAQRTRRGPLSLHLPYSDPGTPRQLNMTTLRVYPLESLLIVITILLTLGGFWRIYAGAGADASAYHHLHIATLLVWLSLLVCQLALAEKGTGGITVPVWVFREGGRRPAG